MATIWDNIPRALDDTQTIGEAINEAINDHNADNTAHLGDDESLQSHRAAEIIDHLAESVVNDKLKKTARRYVAIVDPDSISDFDTIQSAVDYAVQIGGGDIFIKRGIHYVDYGLKLLPTISIVGEGQYETQVIFNGTNTERIEIKQTVPALAVAVGTATTTSGSDIVSASVPLTGDFDRVLGLVLATADGVTIYYPKVLEVVDSTHYRVDRTATTGSGYTYIYLRIGAQATNGSDILELPEGQVWDGSGVALGQDIYFNTANTGLTAVEFLDERHLRMSAPYTGTTAFYFVSGEFNTKINMAITDMTIKKPAGGFVFSPDNPAPRTDFARIELLGGARLTTGFDANSTIRDSIIECNAGGQLYLEGLYSIENTVFRAVQNAAIAFEGGWGTTIRNCYFESNGYTNHVWLSNLYSTLTLINNTFDSCGNIDFSLTSDETLGNTSLILGNSFTFNSGKKLTISGDTMKIIGNDIKTTSAAVTMGGSSSKNILIGNTFEQAFVPAGSKNWYFANTPESMAVVFSNGISALDFANNRYATLPADATKTLTTTVPPAGTSVILVVKTTSATSRTFTFGTGFKSAGTLVTGTTTNRAFTLKFTSDGSDLIESSRSGAIAL